MRSLLAKLVLFAGLVALAAWHVDMAAFGQALSPRLLLAAVAIQPLAIVGLVVSAGRFRTLLGPPWVRLLPVAKSQVLALGMNVLLPGRMSEIFKVTYLRDHAGVGFAAGCSAVLLERLVDIVLLGTVAAASVSLLLTGMNWMVIGIAIAAAAGMFALPLLEPLIARMLALLPSRVARDVSGAVLQETSRRLRDGSVGRSAVFGAAVWALAYANLFLFLHLASDGAIRPEQALAVFVASLVGVAIPALPGGFGTFEAAVVWVLGRFGYPLADALAMALVLHAAQVLPLLAGALMVSARERMGIGSLLRDSARAIRTGPR